MANQPQNSFRKFVSQFTVKDLIPKDFKLVRVNSDTKIIDTLRKLREHKILSVPVYDTNKNEYTGFCDILDLVTLVVTMADMKQILDVLTSEDRVDLLTFIEKENELIRQENTDQIINASERNPWCDVYEGLPLTSLMDMFSKDVNLHRVAVTDGNGSMVGIISQSRVIEFLVKNIQHFSDCGNVPLSKIEDKWVTPKEIFSIKKEDQALDGFQKIVEKQVMAVAVIDEEGNLLGCISANDLKCSMDSDIFNDLYLSVEEFVKKNRPDLKLDKAETITCDINDTLESILDKLSQKHVHRLFLVKDGKPTRVVSLCDIITVLSKI